MQLRDYYRVWVRNGGLDQAGGGRWRNADGREVKCSESLAGRWGRKESTTSWKQFAG